MCVSDRIDLAQKAKVKLPSFTVEGLTELVFKPKYQSLAEYLVPFGYTTAVMQTPESLERIAYELACDNRNEGVLYIEVRFAPQLHVNRYQNMEQVLKSVDAGLRKAQAEHNELPEVKEGRKPRFQYGIIASALRKFSPEASEHYSSLHDVHSYTGPRDLYSLASLELAHAAVHVRDNADVAVVGFDLAGEEAGYPAEHHWEAFDYAHRHFLKKTVHAGEAYGPESIFQAITDLKADRIGHGYYLFDASSITDESITDKDAYVENLAEYIADRRITIEVCLTSNMQTNPKIKDLSDQAFRKMRKSNLSTTFCTDNRAVSHTTVTKEIFLAANTFEIPRRELKDIIIYGFKRSFFPGNYNEKREYVRKVIDYFEAVEEKFFGSYEPKQ